MAGNKKPIKPNGKIGLKDGNDNDYKYVKLTPKIHLHDVSGNYPDVPETDKKPTIGVYVRLVFDDTGTKKDLAPVFLQPNDTMLIEYNRFVSHENIEKRKGIQYKKSVDGNTSIL